METFTIYLEQLDSTMLIYLGRLGNERHKSKPVFESLNPRWLEQFDLYLFPDQSKEMEITVWDKDQRSKDDFMGR
jgi:Ca2+-dependent lipid-binding protein